MKSYNLYQVDSFTKQKFSGNPAGVVTNAAGLNEVQMQKIARELNNSETAFIFPPVDADHDLHVRFFTPTMEVPMCGHATIAAHYAYSVENNLPSMQIVQKVGAGNLPVDIVKTGQDYKIIMTQGDIKFESPFNLVIKSRICDALGIVDSDLEPETPIQIVSTGHSKILVCLKSFEQLRLLTPTFSDLIKISHEVGCNGYLVFTKDSPDPNCFINARMFGPALGINEDPVNGSSGGALGAYLVRHQLIEHSGQHEVRFKVRQGFSVDRPGIVEVVVDIDEAGNPTLGKIIGDAVIVYKAELVV